MHPRVEVSIIIPVLNQVNNLEESLNLLFRQNYPKRNIEIIVIDNGSTDGTWEMLQQIEGIKIHQIPDPKSPYVCRNKGIEISSKEWLLFLDSKIKIEGSEWLDHFIGIDPDPQKIYYARILPITQHLSISQWCEMISFFTFNSLAKEGLNGVAGCFLAHRKSFSIVGDFIINRSGGDTEWSKKAISIGYIVTAVWDFPVFYAPKKHGELIRKLVRIGVSDRTYFLSKDGSVFKFYFRRILEMRPPNPIRIYKILKSEDLHQKNLLWYFKVIFTTWYYRIYQKLITLNLINGQSD